jgi:hypothetical protein
MLGFASIFRGGPVMHRPRVSRSILPAALAAAALTTAIPERAAAQLFRQDLTLHETTTSTGMMGAKGGEPRPSTLYLSSNAMRHTQADGTDIIMRFDQNKMIFVDNTKKSYSEATFEELQQRADQAAAQAGKGMNKEQMEAMRQVMGGASAAFKVSKAGPGERIAGYATEKWLMSFGPVEMELSAAPELKIPPAYYNALKIRMPANVMFDMGKMYEEMKKIDGLALKSVMNMQIMNMRMTSTTVVTSVEKGAIPASVFQVPAGYTATPLKF